MWNELKAIQDRLTALIGKHSHEVILLNARLNCRNCKLSRYRNEKGTEEPDVWECTLYGKIPKENVGDGCGSWINNCTNN